jgi:Fe-coproporphyrin III synthase
MTQGPALAVELVDTFEQFQSLEKEWNGLLARCGYDTVFLRHEWFSCWWRSFGKGRKLSVLLAREGGELAGAAPLMIDKGAFRGVKVRRVAFIGNDNTPRADFIIPARPGDVLGAVFAFLNEHKNLWDIIDLENIPSDSPNIPALSSLFEELKTRYCVKEGLHSPFIRIASDWNSYYSAKSDKFRKVFRNKVNRVKRLGEYSVKKTESVDASPGILDEIRKISKLSWKGECGRDLSSIPGDSEFFERLSVAAGAKGWLNIWTLSVNGENIAYEYHLKYGNRVHGLRADFKEALKDYSPGSVLDLHIVQSTFDGRAAEYDMTGSNDFYKRNWTQDVHDHSRVIVFNGNVLGKFLYFLEAGVIGGAKRAVDPMKRAFHKAVEIYKQQGALKLLARLLAKLWSLIFRMNSAIWFEKDLRYIPEFKPTIPATIDVSSTKEAVEWLKSQKDTWLVNDRELEAAERNGHIFAVVRHDGGIVGVQKVGLKSVYVADYEKEISLPEKMAFIVESYIAPEFRGKVLALFLIVEVMRHLKQQGFTRVRTHVPLWNKASLKTAARIGFRNIGIVRCFHLLGLTILTGNPLSDSFGSKQGGRLASLLSAAGELRESVEREFNNYRVRATHALVFLTYKCTSRCKTCNIWQRPRESDTELSWEQWEKILTQMKDYGIRTLEIFGGDALLRQDVIFEMIRFCSRNNIQTFFPTNSVLLDRETAKKLVDSGLNTIYFSLDDVGSESDDIRGVNNTFDKVKQALESVIQAKGSLTRPQIVVCTTISKMNFRHFGKIMEFLAGYPIDAVYPRVLSEFSRQAIAGSAVKGVLPEPFFVSTEDKSHALSESDYSEFKGIVRALRQRKGLPYINFRAFEDVDEDLIVGKAGACKKCAMISTLLVLGPGGDVMPCAFFKDYMTGNLTENPLDEVWGNQKHVEFIRAQKAKEIDICRYCISRVYYPTLAETASYFFRRALGRNRGRAGRGGLEVIDKAAEIYTQEGAGQLFVRSLAKLGRMIFRTNSAVWVEKDLRDIPEYKPIIEASVDLSATKEAIEWLKGRKETWLVNAREIETAERNGHIFAVVRHNGEIVGVQKIGFRNVYIADYEKEFSLPGDMAFIVESFIAPEFRGKVLALYMSSETMKYLKQKGFTRVRSHIAGWNKASRKSASRFGYREIGFIRCFRLFGLTILTGNPLSDSFGAC